MEFLSPAKSALRKMVERAQRLFDLLPVPPEGGDRPGLNDSPEKLSDKFIGLIVEAIAQTDARVDRAQVVVQTIAELRALDDELIPTGASILALGYYAANDGGGGLFRLHRGNSDSDDGGATVVLASGSRAKAVFQDKRINVLRFGAKADWAMLSWSGTDSTSAIQAAINYARAQSSNGTWTVYIPPGSYGITSLLANNVSISGAHEGTDTAYRPTTLCHIAGATADMLDLDEVSGGAYLQRQNFQTIEHILFVGSRERNLKNPKTITSASSRTVFFVNPADVPAQPSDYLAWPYYGVAAIFSSENRFVGHVVVQSVNPATGQITVAAGYDNYATLSGSSGLLTAGWKICFPGRGTLGSSPADRLDNTSGGYAAIKCLGSGFKRIRNCNFISLHCGIRAGSCLVLETSHCWSYGLSLSILAKAWLDSGADDSHFRLYNQGAYFPDYGLTTETLSLVDTEYRRCAFGLFGLRARGQYNQFTADTCVTGIVEYSGFQANLTQTLIDSPVKTAILQLNGSSLSAGTQYGDVQISAYRYTIPTYVTYPSGARDAIVALGPAWADSVVISSLSVIRWPGNSSANDWANIVCSTGTSSVRISQFIPGTGYTNISSAGNYPLFGDVADGLATVTAKRWGVVRLSDAAVALASNGSEGVRVNAASVGAAPTVGIRNPGTIIGHVDQVGFHFSYGSDQSNNATRTDAAAKTARWSSVPYTLSQNNVNVVAATNDGTNNILAYGGSIGDMQAATDHRFYAAGSPNTLTGTFVARINTGGMVIGPGGISGNIPSALAFEVRSTSKAGLPLPKMTTAEFAAIASPVEGGGGWDTTLKRPVWWDGTRARTSETALRGSVTWDIPSTATGGEQTTTVNIAGAAVGDLVLVSPSRIAQGFLVVGVVQSAGVVSLYATNAYGSTLDPVSQTFNVHVLKA